MDFEVLATRGRVRPVLRWGSPVLHAPTEAVGAFDDSLLGLVADLAATLRAAGGVGLSAPQVGVPLAVFAYDCPDATMAHRVGFVCNPVISLPSRRDRRVASGPEGCLSLPGVHATLGRPDTVTCSGVDQHGDPIEVAGTGLLARTLQHETDHMQGKVLADRLPRRAASRLLHDHDAVAARYPISWPVSGPVGPVR